MRLVHAATSNLLHLYGRVQSSISNSYGAIPFFRPCPIEAFRKHNGDVMSAIDFLHTVPEDQYELVSTGEPPRTAKRRFASGLRETLRALAIALFATGIMAGVMAVRFLGFLPATFHFHG